LPFSKVGGLSTVMDETVYLDLETTGLDDISDEIVEIAIIDDQGKVLLDTLVKPVRHESWPQAEAIHGISPAMVKDAPLFIDLRETIQSCVEGKRVVIYNASFDTGFLGSLLNNAKAVVCCMQTFSEYMNEPHYKGGVKWQSLATATHYIGYTWPDDAHRALADCEACRAVWHYLSEESQQQRELEIKDRAAENKANKENNPC